MAVLAVMQFVEIGSDGVPSGGRWIDLAGTDSAAAYVTYADDRPIGIVFRGLDPPPEGSDLPAAPTPFGWSSRFRRALSPSGRRVWRPCALVLPVDEMLVGFGITIEPIEEDDPDPSSEFPPITFPAR